MSASIAIEVQSGTVTVRDRGPQGYSSGQVPTSPANTVSDPIGPVAQTSGGYPWQ